MQSGFSLVHFPSNLLPGELVGDRFLTADGQHGSTIQPFVWPDLPALSLYLDARGGTGLPGTGLLDC